MSSLEIGGRRFRQTKFRGRLRFVRFADYEGYGPTLMIYTERDFNAKNNPGPIGFIPLSDLP